jgi:transcriptional regulator with XRE-family HTH domain
MARLPDLRSLIADNAQWLLDGADLSHEAAAERTGLGKGSVGRLSRGDVNNTIKTLDAFAEGFGLAAWQLLATDLRHGPPELLTPEVRQELQELRALRSQLEALARGRPESDATSASDGATTHRKGAGKKPAT